MVSKKKKVTKKATKVQAKTKPDKTKDLKKKTPKKAEKVSGKSEVPKEASGPTQKTPKSKAHRLEETQDTENEDEPRGTIYLGHVPDGFFEPQMKKYFSQFGEVTRLRLSRSKKTGGSKGYAFIEFQEESVAKVVAQTMHKYLLFGRQLVCEFMPKEKCHPRMFRGWKTIRKDMRGARLEKEMQVLNDRPTVEVNGKALPQMTLLQVRSRSRARKKLKTTLEQLEIDYDIEGIEGEGDDTVEIEPKVSEPSKGKEKRMQASDAVDQAPQVAKPKPKKKVIRKK